MKERLAPDRSLTPTLSQGSLPGEGTNERYATFTLNGGALADTLLARREEYNQRFLRARHQHRQLSAERFAEVLREQAAPIAEAVAAIGPGRLDATVAVLYDSCLRLAALDLLGTGSRMPAMNQAFDELLPAAARLIATEAERLVPALVNAVYHLSMEPGADPRRWVGLMAQVARLGPEVEDLLAAGQTASWVCGLAHYRDGALALLDRLPPGIARVIFGLGQDLDGSELRARLTDPWWRPHASAQPRALRLVARAGGFVGFGGPFVEPPEVARFGERLYAFDRQCAWTLFADSFGVVLQRYGTSLPEGDPVAWSQFGLDRQGNLSRGSLRASHPQLAYWSSLAATEHTLAVCLPHSHQIFLLAVA